MSGLSFKDMQEGSSKDIDSSSDVLPLLGIGERESSTFTLFLLEVDERNAATYSSYRSSCRLDTSCGM